MFFFKYNFNFLYRYYPAYANLSYMWNFGVTSGICLVIQVVTGIFLAMHYVPSSEYAFLSIEHIMRDVTNGWLIHYLHANGASFFFLFFNIFYFTNTYES